MSLETITAINLAILLFGSRSHSDFVSFVRACVHASLRACERACT